MELRGIPSRNALARRADIHEQHLYKILTGRLDPTLTTFAKICAALECHPGDLLNYVPDDEP